VVVAVHRVRLPEPLGIDQGLAADFARWVPRGWLPYRDLFDSRPPLFLYWWAIPGLTGGDVARAAWWWEGVWLVATLAAAYAIATRVCGRWVGLAAAALLFLGAWSPAWGGFGSRAQAEELVALPMLASAWLAWRAVERRALALGAGILVGVCGLFAIPSMAIALSWVVTWMVCVPLRDAGRRTALMTAGIVGPWVSALGWFAAHHATSSFVDGVVVYPRLGVAFIAPPWGEALQQLVTRTTGSPLLLVAAGIGVYRLARGNAAKAHWVASWIVATLAAVVLQRSLTGHAYLLVVPALAMAGAFGVVDLARTLREPASRRVAGAAAIVLGGLLVVEAHAWWRAYEPDLALLTGRTSREEYLRALQPGGSSVLEEEQAAAWVRERTAPGDGILVWGRAPGLYALADRRPVTRYPLHKVLLTDAPLSRAWPGLDARRADFMARLQRDPPALVLIGQGDPNPLEPLDSYASLTRFRELRLLLQRDYTTEGEVGRFLVARRTGAP
jgi:hypothetical protein